MTGAQRRAQVLAIAAEEFAAHGLHGASTEDIAKSAQITQPYIFRMFGTKKGLFVELVRGAFATLTERMRAAAAGEGGLDALSAMGLEYYEQLADRTSLLLQLQAFAACGDVEVREVVRECFAALWDAVAEQTGVDPVTVKTFLAFGMLLNTGAALDVDDLDENWAHGVRTRINPALFGHITTQTNR